MLRLGSLVAFVLLSVFLLPASEVHAITPPLTVSPGCRLATQQDQAQRAARGIPPAFQVCPGDEEILGIGQDFEQWYAQLRAMPPCNKNTCTLSCRTRNTGAQVCGPTASRWNALGCHPNNRTAIFPTVSHGFAAHIELLRRYCAERGQCTIAGVNKTWSTENKATYAAFVSRAAGMPANQVYDPNDINLMGRIALAMSCFEAGAMPYSVQELKQGLVMAGGGARVPIPNNVGQLVSESMTGYYVANPPDSPNSFPGSWAYPPGNVNGNGNYMPNPPPPSPWQSQSIIGQSVPIGNSEANGGSSNAGQSNSGGQGPPGEPSLNIVVWPESVQRGGTLQVSWTSVNMVKDTCQVLFQGAQFAKTSEGSKPFKIVSSDVSPLTFTFECNGGDEGKLFEVSDSATII
jgi:hypothetical protein